MVAHHQRYSSSDHSVRFKPHTTLNKSVYMLLSLLFKELRDSSWWSEFSYDKLLLGLAQEVTTIKMLSVIVRENRAELRKP